MRASQKFSGSTPIGSLAPFQNLGTEFTDPYSGMTWLRTGVVKAAGSYPQAASHPALQVFGNVSGAVSGLGGGLYDIATDGAGNYAAATSGTTSMAVSTDDGATWTTLAHNLTVQCTSVSWDATNALWIFAGNDAANLKISTSPNLSTAATLRATLSLSGTGQPSTATVRSAGGKSLCIVGYAAPTTASSFSSNGTSWGALVSITGMTPGCVAKNGTRWAVVGNASGMQYACTSDNDGTTWAGPNAVPSGFSPNGISSGNGLFLGIGTAGQVFTSASGDTGTWTQYNLAGTYNGEYPYASKAAAVYVDGVWRIVSTLGIIETSDMAKTVVKRPPSDFSGASPMLAAATGGKFVLMGNNVSAYGTSLTTATYVGVPKMSGPTLPNAVGAPYYYARIK